MDVSPPIYTVSQPACSGEVRACAGGDVACRDGAARDGYVAITNYTFCRRDEVRTVPTASGYAALAVVAALVAAGVALAWRRRRQRS